MKAFCLCISILATVIVICGKVPAVGSRFLAQEPPGVRIGDLYRLCELDRFREELKEGRPSPTIPLDRAEIITLGDSFFNGTLGSDLVASEIAKKGGYEVHNVPEDGFFEPYTYPLAYLKSIGYRPDRRRILILESVERSSLDRTGTYASAAGDSSNRLNAIAFKVLKNNDVEFFFKNNVVTHPFLKELKNLRFEWFGIVDRSIGAYSLQPSMLFYQRDVEFAAQKKSDAILDAAADGVADLARRLRSEFGLDLLYVVVPDKFSVYRDLLPKEKPYDRYIPRLVERLRGRGVHAVDLWSAYRSRLAAGSPPFYYVSDTHFTPAGKDVLVEECLKEIAAMKGEQR